MPYKNKEDQKAYYQINKIKQQAYQRIYQANHVTKESRAKDYAANPEKYLNKRLKQYYRITLEEYNQMLISQNGVCAICQQPETRIRDGKVSLLAVDHDHETGKNRGLLCFRCNLGIGYFQDDSTLTSAATSYLLKFK